MNTETSVVAKWSAVLEGELLHVRDDSAQDASGGDQTPPRFKNWNFVRTEMANTGFVPHGSCHAEHHVRALFSVQPLHQFVRSPIGTPQVPDHPSQTHHPLHLLFGQRSCFLQLEGEHNCHCSLHTDQILPELVAWTDSNHVRTRGCVCMVPRFFFCLWLTARDH